MTLKDCRERPRFLGPGLTFFHLLSSSTGSLLWQIPIEEVGDPLVVLFLGRGPVIIPNRCLRGVPDFGSR